MDIRQIKYFHAVVESGSLSSASEVLNVSQPAIGMQVRNLEDEFGIKLLVRHSRGVKTTPAGSMFFAHATRILQDIDRAAADLRRFRGEDRGAIRVGVTNSLARYLVPQLLELAAERHPDLSLVFVQGLVPEISREWDAGNTDFTFTDADLETDTAESIPLYYEKFMLIGAADMMADLPEIIPLETLVDLPLIYDARNTANWANVQAATEVAGLTFRDASPVESIFLRRAFILKRNCFTIAPSVFFHEEIESGACQIREIALPSLTRLVQLAGPRVERMTKSESAVRQMIVDLVDRTIDEGLYRWEKVGNLPTP